MNLCVVVLNYRTPKLVEACLRSLAAECSGTPFSTVVVDNDSQDGSAEYIAGLIRAEGWGDRVRLLCSPKNGGFSAGNNFGMRAVEADAYLLLNSDTVVKPGAVGELLTALQSRPDVGLVGPRLESEDGEPVVSCFRWPRPCAELIRAAATGPITSLLRSREVPMGVFDEPLEPEWISFAAVLIRAELIGDIGYLDDGYFMYFEDIDYCRRARQAGWGVLHWPNAAVVHLHGRSSPVESLARARRRRPRYYYAARARYYAKYYGRLGLWRANAYWLLGRGVSGLRELLQRGRARASCEAEWKDNWINAWHPLDGAKR